MCYRELDPSSHGSLKEAVSKQAEVNQEMRLAWKETVRRGMSKLP